MKYLYGEAHVNAYYNPNLAASSDAVKTVVSNNITQVILGESDTNTNKININVKTESSEKLSAISFNANYLKEILAANRDHTNGKMEVCAGGLAILTFTNADYTSKYYLVQTNV